MSTDLRKEYNRLRNTGILVSECGDTCVNCGSDTDVEYHHIVPLSLGGTNNLRNIVPLCHRCHCAAHRGQHLSHYVSHKGSGRKPKITDEEAFPVYDRWLDGQFGNKKCAELLKLSGGTHPTSTKQYERYLEARGIQSIRNNYDCSLTLSVTAISDGYTVGQVTYLDGTTKPILFHDLGENDDVEYSFCGSNRKAKTVMTWGDLKAKRKHEAEEAAEKRRQEIEAYRLEIERREKLRSAEEKAKTNKALSLIEEKSESDDVQDLLEAKPRPEDAASLIENKPRPETAASWDQAKANEALSWLEQRARQVREQEQKRLEEAARREAERLEKKKQSAAERKEMEKVKRAAEEAVRQARIEAEIEETKAIRRERLAKEKAGRAEKVVPISKQETFKPLTAEEQRKRDAWWKEYRKQYVMA